MKRRILAVLIMFVLLSENIYAILDNIGTDFNLLIRKEGLTDLWFYDPDEGSINTETNTFLFSRDNEDTSTEAKDKIGIAWTIYSSDVSSIILEFSDNYTEEYMLRYLDGNSPYNYSVSVSEFESTDVLNSKGIFNQPANINAKTGPMPKEERCLVITKNTGETFSYPLTGHAVLDLTLAPGPEGFMSGQYSGQIILKLNTL